MSERKPGPDPEHLKLDQEWEEAIDKALRKEKPKGGWPETPVNKEDTDETDDDQD